MTSEYNIIKHILPFPKDSEQFIIIIENFFSEIECNELVVLFEDRYNPIIDKLTKEQMLNEFGEHRRVLRGEDYVILKKYEEKLLNIQEIQ